MKMKVLFSVVISILIIITIVVSASVVLGVSGELSHKKSSPATTGASFEYSFGSTMSSKSFTNSDSVYKNETLNSGDFYVNGHIYINVTGTGAYFNSYVCNSSGKIIAHRNFFEPLNATIFKGFFPQGNNINAGNIIIFGNNIIAIHNKATQCAASRYTLHYGRKSVEYIPYNGKVKDVKNKCFNNSNNSFLSTAQYIQSKNYSILDSVSIPGNSSIAAAVLDNIGIQTSWFTMKLDNTNVRITAINYAAYIEKYTLLYAMIWIIGIGYLLSLNIKKRK
jgi:hypothetical protein